jgi:hypothetical protein
MLAKVLHNSKLFLNFANKVVTKNNNAYET